MSRLAAALAAFVLPAAAMAAPESYTIDPFHTYPHFTVSHLGFSTMHGRFDSTSGKIVLDRAARTGSVEITIDAASITTGDTKRPDGHRATSTCARRTFSTWPNFPRSLSNPPR